MLSQKAMCTETSPAVLVLQSSCCHYFSRFQAGTQLFSKSNCFHICNSGHWSVCCTTAFNAGWSREVCSAGIWTFLGLLRLEYRPIYIWHGVCKALWNHYATFVHGIPTCLRCSLSKASLTGDWKHLPGNTYLSPQWLLVSVECAFWLPEEEITSIRTRLESDTMFDSWIVFACYNHHNICKGRRMTHCSCKNQKVTSMQEAPAESFIENPSLSVQWCGFQAVCFSLFSLFSSSLW